MVWLEVHGRQLALLMPGGSAAGAWLWASHARRIMLRGSSSSAAAAGDEASEVIDGASNGTSDGA